jgi:hypothetical protein
MSYIAALLVASLYCPSTELLLYPIQVQKSQLVIKSTKKSEHTYKKLPTKWIKKTKNSN